MPVLPLVLLKAFTDGPPPQIWQLHPKTSADLVFCVLHPLNPHRPLTKYRRFQTGESPFFLLKEHFLFSKPPFSYTSSLLHFFHPNLLFPLSSWALFIQSPLIIHPFPVSSCLILRPLSSSPICILFCQSCSVFLDWLVIIDVWTTCLLAYGIMILTMSNTSVSWWLSTSRPRKKKCYSPRSSLLTDETLLLLYFPFTCFPHLLPVLLGMCP